MDQSRSNLMSAGPLLSALSGCAGGRGRKQILGRAVVSGLWADPFVSGSIIAAISGADLFLAQLAFEAAPRRSAFAYTCMIRAHSAGPAPSASLLLFSRMLRSGLYPDRFALPFLLRASARSLRPPSALHALSFRHGLQADAHVATSLLHAYAASGLLASAIDVFDEMPQRTEVTWSAVIACCARSAYPPGLALFGRMISTGVRPNADALTAALSCCAAVSTLSQGRAVHALSVRTLTAAFACRMATPLIGMYARCGSLCCALKVFDRSPAKDSLTWTAGIGALAMHGRGRQAVELFDRMTVDKVSRADPDSVTFITVLNACSHSGLVEDGLRIFDSVKDPQMEHYGALVDMLSRTGRLDEAEQVVASMPFEPSRAVWGSLLHACMVHGEADCGKRLEGWFLGLGIGVGEEHRGGGFGGGFFVGLSNVYAGACRWEEVEKVREKMMQRGVKKTSAHSLLEVEGKVHRFLVGDVSHPLALEIYQMLHWVNEEIMLM